MYYACGMLCRYISSVLVLLLYFNILVSGESCLQALRRSSVLSDPPFTDGDLVSLPASNAVQAIITTYKFHCSCRITTWETYVHPSSNPHVNSRVYDITFQVWRPSPTVQDDGCYSLVGENVFTRVIITAQGYVQLIPPSNSIITAQSGDVVGYYTNSNQGPNEGIQLEINNDYSDNMIWYRSVADGSLTSSGNNACPYPVGTGRSLSTSTTAAPMLRISSDSVTCSVPILTPSSPSLQMFTASIPNMSPSIMDDAVLSSRGVSFPSPTTTIPNSQVQMTSDVTMASNVPMASDMTTASNVPTPSNVPMASNVPTATISNMLPLRTSIYPSVSGGTTTSPMTPAQSTTENSNGSLNSTTTAIISALAATTFISVFGVLLVVISVILIARKIRKTIAINKEVFREARDLSNDFSIDQIELEYEVVDTDTPTTTEDYSTISQVCNIPFAMRTNEAYVAHTEKIDDTPLVMKTNAAYALIHKERD